MTPKQDRAENYFKSTQSNIIKYPSGRESRYKKEKKHNLTYIKLQNYGRDTY